jgi:hypothetical protein
MGKSVDAPERYEPEFPGFSLTTLGKIHPFRFVHNEFGALERVYVGQATALFAKAASPQSIIRHLHAARLVA